MQAGSLWLAAKGVDKGRHINQIYQRMEKPFEKI